jgi:hypothetical protein
MELRERQQDSLIGTRRQYLQLFCATFPVSACVLPIRGLRHMHLIALRGHHNPNAEGVDDALRAFERDAVVFVAFIA